MFSKTVRIENIATDLSTLVNIRTEKYVNKFYFFMLTQQCQGIDTKLPIIADWSVIPQINGLIEFNINVLNWNPRHALSCASF